jgi:cytochrome c oxidase subunit II
MRVGWSLFYSISGASALLVAACSGPQSALSPAGKEAERIAELFWWMTAGALLIWVAVVGIGIYTALGKSRVYSRSGATKVLIIGGGALLPTVILALLLVYGLSLLPQLAAPAPEGSLRIAVSGEQWWWRVSYLQPGVDTATVELANEIHLPVGEPVEFRLESPDVIHSFWIPALAGKIDMIPGRVTRLALTPTKTGVFRGTCAEYCGTSHALMSFYVVVEEKEAFNRWLAQQQAPALKPTGSLATHGQTLFLANGCGACHTIRGTPANGMVGPDLTHFGSRASVGAGIVTNSPDALLRWIAHTEQLKPGVLMPSFDMLPKEDLEAMAAYLQELK